KYCNGVGHSVPTVRVRADLEAPVGREAQAVARAAEGLAHGRDEAHAAAVARRLPHLRHSHVTRAGIGTGAHKLLMYSTFLMPTFPMNN
ncbi:jg4415, partial [Pararge aegeria aegeria]